MKHGPCWKPVRKDWKTTGFAKHRNPSSSGKATGPPSLARSGVLPESANGVEEAEEEFRGSAFRVEEGEVEDQVELVLFFSPKSKR